MSGSNASITGLT